MNILKTLALSIIFCVPLFASAQVVGTTYFVSPLGSNSNDGISSTTPWQSSTKVNATTLHPGDTVSFQGGQTFTGCLVFSNTNIPTSTPTNPIVVGSYGTGNATLVSNCPGTASGTNGPKSALVTIDHVSGFTLQNLILSAGTTTTQYGVLVQNSQGGTADTITIQNNDIFGFHINNTATFDWSSEVYVVGGSAATGTCGMLNNIKVLSNMLHGAAGVNSSDDAGITGKGCGTNVTNVLYQGNTLFNLGGRPGVANGISGNGIIANGVKNGILQHNVAHDLGANTNSCGGPGGIWAYDADNITIQYNEVYNMQPTTYISGCDWIGFDLDGGVTNSVIQYNYSHNNFGPGYITYADVADMGHWGPNTIRYNISVNDARSTRDTTNGSIGLGGPGTVPEILNVYNNTVWQANPGTTLVRPTAFAFITSVPTSGIIANNILAVSANEYGSSVFMTNNNMPLPAGVILRNNNYYSIGTSTPLWYNWSGASYTTLAAWQAASGEVDAKNVNPIFLGGGTAQTCAWTPSSLVGPKPCPNGYTLGTSSPLFGAGVDLSASPYNLSLGFTDYYGVTIPTVAGYNIGADGRTVTVAAALDTTPPSVPPNVTATPISTTQIDLVWASSTDNVAVTSYHIYRGGVQIATSTTLSFANVGLATSTTYTYEVRAVDAAGNLSATSTSVSTSTKASVATFLVGALVVPLSNVAVLSRANTNGRVVCTVATGTVGSIIGGPTNAQGSTWFNVRFSSSCSGWVMQNSLGLVSVASTPIVNTLAKGWAGREVIFFQNVLGRLGYFGVLGTS